MDSPQTNNGPYKNAIAHRKPLLMVWAFVLLIAVSLAGQKPQTDFMQDPPEREITFWANQRGIPKEEVRAIREAAVIEGSVEDIDVSKLNRLGEVLVVETQGSARCHYISILKKENGAYRKLWSVSQPTGMEGDMTFCTQKCGGFRATLNVTNSLVPSVPYPADSEDPTFECGSVKFDKWEYQLNGSSFELTERSRHKAEKLKERFEEDQRKNRVTP